MIQFTQGWHSYYVYIITNKFRSTYYVGVTNILNIRLQQHRENILLKKKTFASKYNLEHLVYYEEFSWIQLAIAREKEIKGCRRGKKLELLKDFNENFEFINYLFQNTVLPPASE